LEVVEEVKKYISVKRLTVWGRSMGAVTAIMMAERKKILIDSLVLDSPFQNLLTVIQRVIKSVT
jgi:pimeloyl-ACP methyl ester carboxylesterase